MLVSITLKNDEWVVRNTNIQESLSLDRVIKAISINTNGILGTINLSVSKNDAYDICDKYLKFLGYSKDISSYLWVKNIKSKLGVNYGTTSDRRRVGRNTINKKSSNI